MTPNSSNHSLYLIKLLHCSCYPERNFRGNQLLDGSISLSPLYSSLTNDLHVSIATSLHQSFPWLHPTQEQFTIFRVLTTMLLLQPFSEDQGGSVLPLAIGTLYSLSLRLWVFAPADSHKCQTPWSVFQDGSVEAFSTKSHCTLRLHSGFPQELPCGVFSNGDFQNATSFCLLM